MARAFNISPSTEFKAVERGHGVVDNNTSGDCISGRIGCFMWEETKWSD